MRSSAGFFLFALVAGVCMRLVLLWLAGSDPYVLSHSDQAIYIDLAEHLRGGGDFGPGFGSERVPVYPAFLAVCFELAGYLGLAAHKLVFAAAVQNALGLLIVPVMFAMGALFSRDTANLAAGFAALNLNMAVYSTQTLTESIFYPLFAFGLLLLFRHKHKADTHRVAAMAIVFGFCTLIRPATQYLPLFMVPYLLVERGVSGMSRRLVNAALFALLFTAALSPWLVRNHALYGSFDLTAQGKPHIIGWIIPAVARYEKSVDLTRAMNESVEEWSEHERSLPAEVRDNPMKLSNEAKRYGLEYLQQASKLSIAKAWFWGAVKNLGAPVAVELAYILDMDWSHFTETKGKGALEQAYYFLFQNENKLYSLMIAAGILLTLAFRLVQLCGAWLLVRSRPGMCVAGAMIVAYFLAVSGPVGYAKYRLPYEPLFVLLTALAVEKWLVRKGTGERRRQ